ncbi:unnamed protein product, partial [Hapterophycus canaliculatus]
IVGGVGHTEFDLIERGVRTHTFTIAQAQPQVSLGRIFRGEAGQVWTKDIDLAIEVQNTARGEEDSPLPVVLDLMQGSRRVWTVPASSGPVAGFYPGVVTTTMPRFEPEDGLYYLRATSFLHHHAFDVSPAFAVTSYMPSEWARAPSTLKLKTSMTNDTLEPGKSYYVSWSSTFVGKVAATLVRAPGTPTEDKGGPVQLLLEGGNASPNTGSLWLHIPFPAELDVQWCPGWQTEIDTPGKNHSSDTDSATNTTSRSCCFRLSVFDARNPDVKDTSGEFCIEPTGGAASSFLGDGESDDLGSVGELGAKVEVVKFPVNQWEIGTAQEIQWTSKQLYSPVVVNLLGPEIEAEESGRDSGDSGDRRLSGPQEADSSDDARSYKGDENNGPHDERSGATLSRNLGGAWQLGSGLPTAGSLLATLGSRLSSEPPMRDIPPGGGYRIEVRDGSNGIRGVSPAFELVAPPGISVSSATGKAAKKGETCRVEWEFTGEPFPIRVQLFQGSPIPSNTSATGSWPPFNATHDSNSHGESSTRERNYLGVRDYALPLYQRCALQVDRDSRNTRRGACMESAQYMKILWQSGEMQVEERATEVTIPRDEFNLPAVGPSFFWKVTSALDPQVHSESKTFSLGYPSVLISFRTSRLNPNSTIKDNPQILVGVLEQTLLLDEGKLKLLSLNGNSSWNNTSSGSSSVGYNKTTSIPTAAKDDGDVKNNEPLVRTRSAGDGNGDGDDNNDDDDEGAFSHDGGDDDDEDDDTFSDDDYDGHDNDEHDDEHDDSLSDDDSIST